MDDLTEGWFAVRRVLHKSLIVGSLFLLIILLNTLYVSALTWTIETVDSAGPTGFYNDIALDSSDNPHISYFELDVESLKYASKRGATWTSETVDTGYLFPGPLAGGGSLALDSGGNPHISYVMDESLKYACKRGGVWSIEIVDIVTPYSVTSIALDSSDNPHISYQYPYPEPIEDLKYAVKRDGIWTTETVDTVRFPQFTLSSIALDSSGSPHISYYYYDIGLKYAVKSGGTWTLEIVDDTVAFFYPPSLALDLNNNPHISYIDEKDLNLDLKYAVKSSGAWSIETVDPGKCYFNSLALDLSGNPHISYQDDGWLKYASKSGGTWITETVPAGSFYTSLALDSSDNPHISYQDPGWEDLMYATVAAPPPPPPAVPEFDLAIPIITSIATAVYLTISKRYKK